VRVDKTYFFCLNTHRSKKIPHQKRCGIFFVEVILFATYTHNIMEKNTRKTEQQITPTKSREELFSDLARKMKSHDGRITKLETDSRTSQERFDEFMLFLKKNMMIRSDLENYATKDDLIDFKQEILTAVDRVTKTLEIHEHEIVAWRGKTDELIKDMRVVQNKLGLASQISQ